MVAIGDLTVRLSVTSRYHGSKISASQHRELKQRRRRQQREPGKTQQVYIRKTTTLHHVFLYVSLLSLHDCDVKLPNFTHPLYEVGEHNAKFSFSFSKLRYGPFGFNPRKFRQHLTN